MELLIDVFYVWLEEQTQGYASGNMFIYFSTEHLKNQDFRGPDFFAVVGVPKGERKSWVVWEEGKAPDVVIELLSESTATIDKTEKKEIYQEQLRVPEYYWFDPFNIDDFVGFSLQNGIYQPIIPDANGGLISQRLGLTLTYWQGTYKTINTIWIRWATPDGVILPTAEEKAVKLAQQAQQEARQAQQEARQAQQEARQAQQEVQQAQQEAQQAQQEAQQAQQEAQQAQQEAQQAQQEAQQAIAKLQRTIRNLLQQGMTVAQVATIMDLPEDQVRELGGR
jgi:Uma2 family endonuclease